MQTGSLEVTSILEMDSFRQYPIDLSKWEIERTTTAIRCNMGELIPGDVFGFDELLKNSKLRMNKIQALEDSFILFISTKNFRSCFNPENISILIKKKKIKNAQTAIDEITALKKWNSMMKSAVVTVA